MVQRVSFAMAVTAILKTLYSFVIKEGRGRSFLRFGNSFRFRARFRDYNRNHSARKGLLIFHTTLENCINEFQSV